MGLPLLVVLAASDASAPLRAISEAAGLPYHGIRKAAHRLADEGLVRLERRGRDVVPVAADPAMPPLAEQLDERGHRALPSIFHGDRPILLWALHNAGATALAAEVLDKPVRTVQHAAQQFRDQGILIAGYTGLKIHHGHDALRELLKRWDAVQAQRLLGEAAPHARLHWHLGPELLFETGSPPAAAQPAGLQAFAQYGIEIRPRDAAWFLGHRRPTAADAILQALLIDGYETPDQRAVTMDSPPVVSQVFNYACLLWEKEEPKDIWIKSDLYFGREHPARDVVEYVAEQGDWAGFIPWEEHERLRKMYGVGT